jgi:uncharacterized surface protein with fasciclin (FAS1) repeats
MMKKFLNFNAFALTTAFSVLLLSCSNDDDNGPVTPEPTANIVQLASATADLSVLVGAIGQADAGLDATLSGTGPFTVFAPTNAAFTALLNALGDDYNSLADFDTQEEKDLLRDILLYHVIPSEVRSTDLAAGSVGTALTGNSLEVIASGSSFVIGDASTVNANITSANIEATNGVVHLIDKVLLPQSAIDFVNGLGEEEMLNSVETAQSVPDLSLLVEALIQADAGLVEVLSGEGPFTIFAPTNAAFAALLEALGDDYNSLADFDTEAEKELLAKVLTYHVVAGTAALSTDLSDGQMIATVQGENVTVSLTGGVFIQDATDTDAAVVTADVETSNGVVHIIDKVLLPQEVLDALAPPAFPNIVATAQSVPDLSLLVDALIQADAGLVEVLSGEGPFTVFAPTNAAFAALLDALGEDFNSLADFDTAAEKELLAKVLTYHVIAGTAALSTDLTEGQSLTTVQGENLGIHLTGGVFIQDAVSDDTQVVMADVITSNGVVHVIDKVLLPQEVLDLLN